MGGLLLIVVNVAEFLVYGDQPESVTAITSAWLILSTLALVGVMFTFVLFALGWLLFALALLQTRVLPRGAALLLMVGAVLSLVLSFLELPFYIVVFGAAQVWIGYELWSGSGEPALSTEAAL